MQPMKPDLSNLDPHFPISQIFREIGKRLEGLGVGVTLEALRFHLWRQHKADDSDRATAETYFERYLAVQFIGKGPSVRLHGNHLRRCLSVLEFAIIDCELALRPEEKPLRHLLNSALEGCERFDKLVEEFEKKKAAAWADRVRGGRVRQAKLEPARRRAARLLLVKAPRAGWDSPAQAARAVEPYVAAFVARRRMSMVGVRRTIVRWISRHPHVSSAYKRRRRPPAP